MRLFLLTFFFTLMTSLALSQNSFLVLDREENLIYESFLVNQTDSFHSSIYPFKLHSVTNYDSLQNEFIKTTESNFKYWLYNKYPIQLFKQTTRIIPLLNIDLSKDISRNPSPYKSGFGFLLHSDIGRKFSLQFAVYGALQHFNIDQQKFIDSTQILPSIGAYNAKLNGAYSYTNWQGYISYQAFKFLNFQVGKDWNFWGDGYRSLILSDNSSPYPFIKATVTAGKIQYLILYQFLKDMDTQFSNYPNERKYSTSHYLSWNIAKRFNINLFETVIWRDELEPGVRRGYDINYMNPVIFLRPVEYSIGSPDNVLMGGGFRIRLLKKTNLYAQVIMDEFKLKEIKSDAGWWANKYGYQVGLKIYDLFKIKNLYVLGEYNTVRPYTYTHVTSMENYGNMYQPLAHPLGANFKEIIGLVNYRKNRWQTQITFSFAKFGIDIDSTNYGQNIYRSYYDNIQEYNNFTLQGELTQTVNIEAKLAYIINPLWNLRLESGIRLFSYSNNLESLNQNTIFITLKTLF